MPFTTTRSESEYMPARPALLPSSLAEVFSRREALAAGVSPRRLRAKDLHQPYRGVHATRAGCEDAALEGPLARDAQMHRDVLRAAHSFARIMPAHAFYVGRTALALYRAPVEHDLLEVGVISPRTRLRRVGIDGRRIAAHLVGIRDHLGLRVASPASAWAMLGNELTVRELVVIGDSLVKIPRDDRGRPRPEEQLATIDQLRNAASAGRRPGARSLLDALHRIRVGSASPLETEYRLHADASELPQPELDVEIRDAAGRLLGISEVVYRGQRVVVEIEGDHHRTSRAQWDRDIEKYQAYTAHGWEVVRLTARHVRSPRGVEIVRATLVRRGRHPDSPPSS